MNRKSNTVLSQIGRRTADSPISWLMRTKLERPNLVSLAAGFTDNESLPLVSSRRLLNELLKDEAVGRAALQYGSTAGDDVLRELTAKRIEQLDKISGDKKTGDLAKRMVITHGSQQFLYILTEALCDPGDIVLVEDPTYFVYLGIMQSRGLNGRGIAMNHDGIDLEHLEMVLESLRRSGELKRTKMLYLVSYFQNPTGRSTSLSVKKEALDLLKKYERAAGHPIYLLEDSAYRELGFSGQSDSSALSIHGASERVIYSGTFSKPFATGVRVGFGVLPEVLLAPFLRIKSNHDFGTSHLIQKLVLRALDSGEYVKNLAKAQHRYQVKANVMNDSISDYFPDLVKWEKPEGGLNFWAELPRSMSTGLKSKLFQEALNQNVLYVPGNLCYVDDPTRRKPSYEMRLSFGAASEKDIRKGIRSLGNVLKCK
ncbi:MAG: PLP-dependent aminotransferase family protein [Verrucomicrobiota bacterium]|nr:PLP-dependent aminotransferase family protein [Verrucomicrobiota bacterium]